jgi:hypothetical protein
MTLALTNKHNKITRHEIGYQKQALASHLPGEDMKLAYANKHDKITRYRIGYGDKPFQALYQDHAPDSMAQFLCT